MKVGDIGLLKRFSTNHRRMIVWQEKVVIFEASEECIHYYEYTDKQFYYLSIREGLEFERQRTATDEEMVYLKLKHG